MMTWFIIDELQKFDLIVIGSGSGLDVANAATQNGLKVAVIEKDRIFLELKLMDCQLIFKK
jgi:glycerol-3-phosphate dehydrogenase